MNKRIDYIDIAKGIAIILVVCSHTYAGPIIFPFSAFSIPLFFFCSGLTCSIRDNMFISFKRKAIKLLKPYIFFNIILFLCAQRWSFREIFGVFYYEKAQNIIKSAVDSFLAGETDKVILVHNGYKNMISQEIRVSDIVPIEPPVVDEKHLANLGSAVEFEPDENAKALLDELVKKYLEYSMYYSLIDSLAAEHSARDRKSVV